MGKEGLEPSRLAARDPKSRLSANSSTSPKPTNYMRMNNGRQQPIKLDIIPHLGKVSLIMGNVVNTDSPSKKREKILRLISTMLEISEFEKNISEENKDELAFIYLSLHEVEKTIAETVRPWEKRDFWLKADKFRDEWGWVKELIARIDEKLTKKKWADIDQEIVIVKSKLIGIEPLKRMTSSRFWAGAFETYKKMKSK